MLKIQSLLLSMVLVGSGIFVTACNDDDDNNGGPNWAQATELVVNKSALALAGTTPGALVVKSPSVPVVSSDASWLSAGEITHREGSKSIYDIAIVAEPNPTYESRTATLTIQCGNQTKTVVVTQYQAETVNVINVDPSTQLEPNGGVLKVTFEATDEVKIEYPEWMARVESRSIEESTVQFRYAANVRAEARGGDIVISLVKDPSVSAVVALTQNVAANGEMKSSAIEIARQMVAGINIGNTLEAIDSDNGPSESAWGNPKVTLQYIQGLKAAGFNAVRIPCAWDGYVIDRDNNTIDPKWLDRVDEVVSYVVGEDMFAIVNIHWDGGWLEETCVKGYDAAVDKKQRDYWTQIANKLNHYGEKLLFAGMNEPGQQDQDGVNAGSIDAIKAYQQTFVDAVRATGGNNATRCLVHQTPYTNIDKGVSSNYSLPSDPVADRTLVEVHFYDPSDFTIMSKDGEWASTVKLYWGAANHVAGSDRNCTWGEESHVDSQFAKVKDHFVSKGIPVIVGEYGVDAGRNFADMDTEKHKASRAYWTEYVTMSAKNHGCVPFYWETGADVNRYSGSLKNAYLINALMNGAANGRYPF